MPKRPDIKKILIIGAGPIVIGQACEFDYSGAQACKALKEEGFELVLVNSNPATIMTDPEMADATYIEPIHWKNIETIIAQERPCAVLPTLGGQTGLNCALDLARHGVLEKYNVEMIGATRESIDMAEDREKFAQAMNRIGLKMPKAGLARSMDEALDIQEQIGFPAIIRPCFTMGGAGGGIAYNREEFIDICTGGLEASPTSELLIDQSILGWKEYEMEVVRDAKDNTIIVCSIENIDPCGIHTGDSITVAPALTLTDKEYQVMRDASIAVLREIGIDTGGSNVQFATNPTTGEMVVIEMNPRVSRSSALASKATGFPIAKVAAKLAVGYTLDELSNEITDGQIPVSFEPSIDYVVTKIPRFNFEKFPSSDHRLTTQMKSVGEVMAIGRTFQESFQKALRSLEIGCFGLDEKTSGDITEDILDEIRSKIGQPTWDRIWHIADAFRFGISLDEVARRSMIDPWFLHQIEDLVRTEIHIKSLSLSDIDAQMMRAIKAQGFSDARIGTLLGVSANALRKYRLDLGVQPAFKRVDSCAAEFATQTAYFYSCYEEFSEADLSDREKIMVLGGGPNRIGQGIEFDYCCVHAALALRDQGYETIMVNCNPETVSTDYDTSDRLYFEPLTLEDLLEIIDVEKPKGVIIHYGGQTPLKLARALESAGVPIIGTSPDAIDRAEDRGRFKQLVSKLRLLQPPSGMAHSVEEGIQVASTLTYPLIVRPSYVLGGRAMEIIHNETDLRQYIHASTELTPDTPLLLDHFLQDAIEIDVDAICDGKDVLIGSIMEHIEQAGVHSGDSACCLPPHTLPMNYQDELRRQMRDIALELGVVGLMNAQFAVRGESIFILEVNPRASRTVPFVSKATGVPLARVAALAMAGVSLAEQGHTKETIPPYYTVKHAIFSNDRFPGADALLGPEMRSTGEVMGSGDSFAEAFSKALQGSGHHIPNEGCVFISVKDKDKEDAVKLAKQLVNLNFKIVATHGTGEAILAKGIQCELVNKVGQGRPHIVDKIKNTEINLIINTTEGKLAIADSFTIRQHALKHKVPLTTTMTGGHAICLALAHNNKYSAISIQSMHEKIKG